MPHHSLRIASAHAAAYAAAIKIGLGLSDARDRARLAAAHERGKLRAELARERRLAEKRAYLFGADRGTL